MGNVPGIFVNEDVSKPENRVNLALLGLLNNSQFREWIIQRLKLPGDSVFYPPQNVMGTLRPDFVVTSSTREQVHGWVEVELGSENVAQLTEYRKNLKERVISIVGECKPDCRCDLSLTEIAKELEEWLPGLKAQQKISVEIVITLITRNHTPSRTPQPPNPIIETLPIMRLFKEHLGHILEFGLPPVLPGRVLITTITQNGWTLRVFAPGALGRSVSLMWDQRLGRGVIRLPSAEHLLRYLPEADDAISDFSQKMRMLGFNIERIKGAQSIAVPEQTILAVMDSLAPLIRRLATVDRALS